MPSTDSSPPPKAPHVEHHSTETKQDDQLKSPKFWIIIFGIYASIFLVALDRMIIATAIPRITDEFHSISDIGWYGSAYMLTGAIFHPLFGRVYKFYSAKWTFITCITIFEIGSAVCGAAPSSNAFIVGRAVAGIGAAGIFTGGIMITIPLIPLHKRPMFTSLYGMAFGISSVLGPLIGGAFTDNSNLTWRWCFYINLPIGGFTIVSMAVLLRLEPTPREKLSIVQRIQRLDPIGLLVFVPSMVCLILALQWGGTTYAWPDPKELGLLVTFAITFVMFLVYEYFTPETAMAPARIVLHRSVGSAMIFFLLVSGSMMAVIYYISLWFQAAQGQSAVQAGIRTIPTVLSLVVFGFIAAAFTTKVGYYVPAMLLSPVLCAIGAGLLSTLKVNSSSAHWIGFQVLYGCGIGSGFQTATLAPQTVLPKPDIPMGMALMFFMQQLGGSVFVPAAQNIFSNQLVKSLSGMTDLDTNAIINSGATALRSMVPQSELGAVLDAYSFSLTRVFILAAGLSAFTVVPALAIEWRSIKQKKNDESTEKEGDGHTKEEA